MKKLGITQRVDLIEAYQEKRDSLDRRWSEFALRLGYLPLPLPNIDADNASSLLDSLQLDAVLLTGGNSLYNPDLVESDAEPERDAFESALLEHALNMRIPVVGVCRGMQMINVQLGGRLSRVEGHVAVRHSLSPVGSDAGIPLTVNSFHNWGIAQHELADRLVPVALDSAGNVEAFKSTEFELLGIMWHPEREQPFRLQDIELIGSVLK